MGAAPSPAAAAGRGPAGPAARQARQPLPRQWVKQCSPTTCPSAAEPLGALGLPSAFGCLRPRAGRPQSQPSVIRCPSPPRRARSAPRRVVRFNSSRIGISRRSFQRVWSNCCTALHCCGSCHARWAPGGAGLDDDEIADIHGLPRRGARLEGARATGCPLTHRGGSGRGPGPGRCGGVVRGGATGWRATAADWRRFPAPPRPTPRSTVCYPFYWTHPLVTLCCLVWPPT